MLCPVCQGPAPWGGAGCRGSSPSRGGRSAAPRITVTPSQPRLSGSGWGGAEPPTARAWLCYTGFSHLQSPTRPPLHTTWLLPSPAQPCAKRRKWGKSRVPFFGPRAWGWPACCRQERENLERFPLRMCQIIQWRGSINRACACLTRMRCPLLQPRNSGGLALGPRQSAPALSGASGFTGRTPVSSRVLLTLPSWISWHSGQASGDRGHALGVHTHTHSEPSHTHKIRTVP